MLRDHVGAREEDGRADDQSDPEQRAISVHGRDRRTDGSHARTSDRGACGRGKASDNGGSAHELTDLRRDSLDPGLLTGALWPEKAAQWLGRDRFRKRAADRP